jgi:endonuclease YncB( thermonuclease family)
MRYLLTATLLLLSICLYAQTTYTGKVTAVKDGDTIEMLVKGKKVRIRLFGIDSPEKGQAFGEKARQYTADLCFGKPVTAVQRNRDQYGRVVADVYLADRTFVNEALVRAGYAWHYKQFSKNEALAAAEKKAREGKLGLWRDRSPTPPWAWRKQKGTRALAR